MLKFGIQIITGIKVKILLLYSDKAQQRVKMSTRLKDFVNSVSTRGRQQLKMLILSTNIDKNH